jgi:hypothetical protein
VDSDSADEFLLKSVGYLGLRLKLNWKLWAIVSGTKTPKFLPRRSLLYLLLCGHNAVPWPHTHKVTTEIRGGCGESVHFSFQQLGPK